MNLSAISALFGVHPFGLHLELLIIFSFVLLLVITKRIFRYQRERLWHETARLALEKGQPLPERDITFVGRRGYRRWTGWCDIRRGLILIAVSAGLFLALGRGDRDWTAIPACIGVVYLILGLVSYSRPDVSDRDDNASGRP